MTHMDATSAHNYFQRIILDIADGLLLGIPSNVLGSRISHKYDIAQQQLSSLLSIVNREIDQLSSASLSKSEIISDLKSRMFGANPMGNWFSKFQDQLVTAEGQRADIDKRLQDLTSQRSDIEVQLAKNDLNLTKARGTLSDQIEQGTRQLLRED